MAKLPFDFWGINTLEPYRDVISKHHWQSGNGHLAGIAVIAGMVGDVEEILSMYPHGMEDIDEEEEGLLEDWSIADCFNTVRCFPSLVRFPEPSLGTHECNGVLW